LGSWQYDGRDMKVRTAIVTAILLVGIFPWQGASNAQPSMNKKGGSGDPQGLERELAQQLERYIEYYRTEQWDMVLSLQTGFENQPTGRERKATMVDQVAALRASNQDMQVLDFKPYKTSSDSKRFRVSMGQNKWSIVGCLEYLEGGTRRRGPAVIEASRAETDREFVFGPIILYLTPEGDNLTCLDDYSGG
jgi:hypothetical protein